LAENLHGWSDQSDSLVEKAADQPEQPNAIVITNDNTFIKFTWVAPFYNYKVILGFEVLAYDKAQDSYIEICEGEMLVCRVDSTFFIDLGYV
jgi:hypothetical protein